ncbi:hypothetical protein K469DRAFT_257338 [Zopfia rhizophila CBS 207.26]|uniref:Uncharacterized protein n=1 Tax=Zopfia rhizophila CBS 207.26 TaxID=1314779 RepID=A0A6A6DUZ0_9PEZI|nr:hypothetical protein K469DRAFT_257338 [Zopfia rhizophila CBS 207.26]
MDEERMSTWRWGLYAGSLVDGIFILVVGAIVEKTGNWTTPLMILYILWAVMFGLFGLTFFERSSRFILRCLYYLICAMLPLAFFGSFSNGDLHLWLPTSFTLGIFVGVGLKDCCSLVTLSRTRRYLLRLLGSDEPILPRYEQPRSFSNSTRTRSPSLTRPLSAATSIIDVDEHLFTEEEPRLLGGPTDNPWTTE